MERVIESLSFKKCFSGLADEEWNHIGVHSNINMTCPVLFFLQKKYALGASNHIEGAFNSASLAAICHVETLFGFESSLIGGVLHMLE